MANNALSSLTPKQKLIGVVITLIVAVVIWQVVELMSEGSTSTSSPAPENVAGKSSKGGSPQNANGTQIPPQQSSFSGAAPTQQPVPSLAPSANQGILDKEANVATIYMERINKLQSLSLERQIAEAQQAIAAANFATTEFDQKMSKLLTAAAPPGLTDYARKMNNAAGSNESAVSATIIKPAVDYSVVSVSMQLNEWKAVLGYQNKYYVVSIGDTLPVDKSIVTAINAKSVTLKKDGATRVIPLLLTI